MRFSCFLFSVEQHTANLTTENDRKRENDHNGRCCIKHMLQPCSIARNRLRVLRLNFNTTKLHTYTSHCLFKTSVHFKLMSKILSSLMSSICIAVSQEFLPVSQGRFILLFDSEKYLVLSWHAEHSSSVVIYRAKTVLLLSKLAHHSVPQMSAFRSRQLFFLSRAALTQKKQLAVINE